MRGAEVTHSEKKHPQPDKQPFPDETRYGRHNYSPAGCQFQGLQARSYPAAKPVSLDPWQGL